MIRSRFSNAQIIKSPLPLLKATSPIVLVGVSILLVLQFQLNLILNVLIPINVALLYSLIWIVLELRRSQHLESSRFAKISQQGEIIEKLSCDFEKAQAKTDKRMPKNLPRGMMELYIDYKKLEVNHLAEILDCLQKAYSIIYGVSKGAFKRPEKSLHLYEESIQKIFRANPLDRFEIEAISSEESIKLRVKTGYLPTLSSDDDHLYIELPKGVVVLIYLGGLLGSSITYGLVNYNLWLDADRARNEQIIREKQKTKLDLEIEKLSREMREAPEIAQDSLNETTKRFLELTVGHNDIKGVTAKSRSI